MRSKKDIRLVGIFIVLSGVASLVLEEKYGSDRV